MNRGEFFTETIAILNVTELDNSEGHALQREEFDVSGTATHVRVSILSGYDHFVSIHRIHVDGTAVHT